MFFVLTLESGTQVRVDSRVKDTVVDFILRQLDKNEDVIFDVCSALKDKEQARQRLFTRWYNQTKPKNIVQATRTVEGDKVYFIFRSDNPLAPQILEAIDAYNLKIKA